MGAIQKGINRLTKIPSCPTKIRNFLALLKEQKRIQKKKSFLNAVTAFLSGGWGVRVFPSEGGKKFSYRARRGEEGGCPSPKINENKFEQKIKKFFLVSGGSRRQIIFFFAWGRGKRG